ARPPRTQRRAARARDHLRRHGHRRRFHGARGRRRARGRPDRRPSDVARGRSRRERRVRLSAAAGREPEDPAGRHGRARGRRRARRERDRRPRGARRDGRRAGDEDRQPRDDRARLPDRPALPLRGPGGARGEHDGRGAGHDRRAGGCVGTPRDRRRRTDRRAGGNAPGHPGGRRVLGLPGDGGPALAARHRQHVAPPRGVPPPAARGARGGPGARGGGRRVRGALPRRAVDAVPSRGYPSPFSAHMKIPLDDIEAAPKELTYTEEVAALNAALARGAHDYRVPEGYQVDVAYHRAGLEVFFEGAIHATVVGTCARCLEEYRFPLDQQFRFVLMPRTAGGPESARLTAEDMALSTYEGDEIDLTPLVDEQAILA